jgi:hypothetical protein
MAAEKAKSWEEKLNIDRKPEIEQVTKPFAGIKLGESLLIPTPKLVDAFIREIPEGEEVAVQS